MRTHYCGLIDESLIGQTVSLCGWVNTLRLQAHVAFVDLRDHEGLAQIVIERTNGDAFAVAGEIGNEYCLRVTGVVRARIAANDKLKTGHVEVLAEAVEILNAAKDLPFALHENPNEDMRMAYRYLDLRRPLMQQRMRKRIQLVRTLRHYLDDRGFQDIETPILTKATPEGARDYLVPSRVHPGQFYALPQSPQLFKQILMVAGFDRYYQIARCFRDEDLRADRQLEFTQLDVEMSFVNEDDVLETMEAVMGAVFEATGFDVAAPPWPRMAFDEAMLRFGSDRPDRRFDLEIVDVSQALRGSEFKVFESVLGNGGAVRALNAGAREMSRSELEGLNEVVQRHGGKAVAWGFVEDGGMRSPIAKFLGEDRVAAATSELRASEGDLLLFVADQPWVAAEALGALRLELGRRFGLIPEGGHDVLWVVDFPMFEPTDEGWGAVHHPFTAPTGDFADPGAMRSRGYDLILDGWELGGGSIRINTPEVQEQVFKVIGMSEEEGRRRFGFLLDALRYGAPPHGGIALGIDRVVALIAGRDSIREVIAFPKTASGSDPLTGAPAPVDARQLRELGVRSIVDQP